MATVHATAPPSAEAAVALRGVTKTFGGTTAVASLDLTIPRGALYGFIGPNGAGKTTSIRMIMSILFPDSGELEVLGRALGARREGQDRLSARGARRVPQDAGRRVPRSIIARLKGVPDKGLAERVSA